MVVEFMLNIIKLELKKYKLSGLIKGALIATSIIFLIVALLFFVKVDDELSFENVNDALILIDTAVRSVFIIYAASLISKLVIDEFKSKTISILFMYPVNRKKILIAKLLIIAIFTFVSIIFANTVLAILFYLINSIHPTLEDTFTLALIKKHSLTVLMNALSATGMSLIPLFFGMRKYSVPATIISSIILVSLFSSNSGGKSLNDIVIIPITLAIIGVLIAFFSIKNIEKTDLLL